MQIYLLLASILRLLSKTNQNSKLQYKKTLLKYRKREREVIKELQNEAVRDSIVRNQSSLLVKIILETF